VPLSIGKFFREGTKTMKHNPSITHDAVLVEQLKADPAFATVINLLVAQQDRLLNLHLAGGIDQKTFADKQSELRDRLASIKLQLDVVDRAHDEMADLAVKAFELSQTLREQWLTADYAAKRRILEFVLSNCTLNDATLYATKKKPFNVLAEGLLSEESGGGGNRTFRRF
jgi:LPS O-antigen subunit length determinant protein (WzzB/FepE family)